MLTPKQLEERFGYLGASDFPKLLGISPYKNSTPYDLWDEKVNKKRWEIDPLLSKKGHLYEEIMAKQCENEYLVKCIPPKEGHSVRSDTYHFLSATPDFWAYKDNDFQFLLECKHVGRHNAKHWLEGPPDYVLIQVLMQMFCCIDNANQLDINTHNIAAKVVCVIGDERAKFYPVEYNEDIINRTIEVAKNFWGYVERKEPLPPGYNNIEVKERVKVAKLRNDKILEADDPGKINNLVERIKIHKRNRLAEARYEKAVKKILIGVIGEYRGIKTEKYLVTYDEVKSGGRRLNFKELSDDNADIG